MTARQKAFAEYYLEYGNASMAARLAGYSAGYAAHITKQKKMKEYLRKRIDEMSTERVASTDEVLEFLTNVMRGNAVDGHGVPLQIKAAQMLAKRMKVFMK